jgi:hypothetical protein
MDTSRRDRLLHFLEDSGFLGSLEASLGTHMPCSNEQHQQPSDQQVPNDERMEVGFLADSGVETINLQSFEELELDVDIDLVLLMDYCVDLGHLCLRHPLQFNNVLSASLRYASLKVRVAKTTVGSSFAKAVC